MKTFACGDVVPGCTAHFSAVDEGGILAAVGAHAREVHGLGTVSDDLVAAVLAHTR